MFGHDGRIERNPELRAVSRVTKNGARVVHLPSPGAQIVQPRVHSVRWLDFVRIIIAHVAWALCRTITSGESI